jgi:hypothetical protein
VLVGPSTAVTPAPGARSLANVGAEEEKAMFLKMFLRRHVREVFHNATRWGRGLSSGTSPERIAPESVTPDYS